MTTRTRKPILLDLFCGAGGASVGYSRAGFAVIGVDWRPQPGYPFRLIQADATTVDVQDVLSTVDAVHASPPCQRYSVMGHPGIDRSRYPDLIPAIRERLQAWGKPWVMENVPLAPLHDPKLVCGVSLGLRVIRHRLFETSWPYQPLPCSHLHGGNALGLYVSFYEGRRQPAGRKTPPHRKASQFREAAGLTWMTTREMRQAIPPAYTEHIGRQLHDYLFPTGSFPPARIAACESG